MNATRNDLRSSFDANNALASAFITRKAMHMHAVRTVQASRAARPQVSTMQKLMRALGLSTR